jgi:hypothetical protein
MYLLYSEIKNRLKNSIEGIKTIALYNNQLESSEMEESFLCPAVFIAFPEITFTSMGKKSQQGKAIITLYVAYESYAESENSEGVIGDEGIFLLVELINKVLHGWHTEKFGALARRRMQTANTWGNIYVVAIDYECEFKEDSAEIKMALQQFGLDTSIQLVDKLL